MILKLIKDFISTAEVHVAQSEMWKWYGR